MRRDRPRILMYHSISRLDDDPYRISTSPERFGDHMRHLRQRGLRGVSMRELRRAGETGSAKRLVGLTFDDGYEDFLREAVPVLERFGFTATVFVVGGMMGEENTWDDKPRLSLMNAEEVREASECGMEVGAHGMSHAKLAGLDAGSLEVEVSESRRVLGEIVGEDVEGLCYPYGSLDGEAVRAVREAGYSYACAVEERVERSGFDLRRIPVAQRDHVPRFAMNLETYWQYAAIRKALRKVLRGGSK